jgi:hypothetical protein
MSLPSLVKVLAKAGITDIKATTEQQREDLLLEAMRHDIPEALEYLHKKSHEAEKNGFADWMEDPKSPLGQQLIRIHASDAFRPIVSKRICHGQKLTFVNCCKGIVGEAPDLDVMLLQIQTQNGDIAKSDC